MFGKAYTFHPKVSFRKYKILKGNKNSTTDNKTGQRGAVRSTSSRSDFQKKTDLKVLRFSKLQKTILHFKSNSWIYSWQNSNCRKMYTVINESLPSTPSHPQPPAPARCAAWGGGAKAVLAEASHIQPHFCCSTHRPELFMISAPTFTSTFQKLAPCSAPPGL